MPQHLKITCIAIGAVIAIVPLMMNFISFIPAAIIAYIISLAVAKMANQSYFVSGPSAFIGRIIFTVLFAIFSIFAVGQFSTLREKAPEQWQLQTEHVKENLMNNDAIKNENAKSFYALMHGSEEVAVLRLDDSQKQIEESMAKADKSLGSLTGQVFLLIISFTLINLGLCRFYFQGAPLPLTGHANTLSVIALSRLSKATLSYIIALITLKSAGVEEAAFISSAIFVTCALCPFTILSLFILSFIIFLSHGQISFVAIGVLGALLIAVEFAFQLIMKPLSKLKSLVPTSFSILITLTMSTHSSVPVS